MFYAPGQDVQRPTHPRLHVRDARDAQTVFEAVRRGVLKKVARRLNESERSMYIQSGSIFVWEESDDELGLKRWTDGRVWSQSRMREPYLFYDEKVPSEGGEDAEQNNRSQAVFRFVDGTSRGSTSSVLSHFDRTAHRPPGLVKQAYSAWVMTTPGDQPRKWHLTAYFTYTDLQELPTVDHDPALRTIMVPPGIYRSGKARSRNSDLVLDGPSTYASSSASSPPPMSPYTTGSSDADSSPNESPRGPPGRPYSPFPNKPSTPMPRGLPPFGVATASSGMPNYTSSPSHRDLKRFSEDQRMIQMLNSRHIR